MNEEKWRLIVSGQRADFLARMMLLLFRAMAMVYWCAITARNAAYNRGLLSTRKPPIAAISIGNITAGGTGKTPIVIWLCNLLAGKGFNPAVLTRGYKGSNNIADEPALIAKNCPNCEVVINSDRFAGAIEIAPKLGTSGVLILDDGFQHRRLSRDLDILTIDATCPFGFDRMLPAGLLREPISGIKRAKAAIITRCDLATEEQVNFAQWRLMRISPEIQIFKAAHKYHGIEMLGGKVLSMPEVAGKKCFAFCGIGNPYAFIECLINEGVSLFDYKIYQDHHNYTKKDIDEILELSTSCELIITTEKDFVKLQGFNNPLLIEKCGCTKLEIKFLTDIKPLEDIILKTIDKRR